MGRETDGSGRRRRRAVTLVVVLAVASPVLRDRDSFPLSTYPMYASARSETSAISTVVGVDHGGSRVSLPLSVTAGTDDALVGHARLRRAIEGGAAATLCADVAERVSESFARVEVVTELHDVVALTSDDESLLDRTLHASCESAA